MSFYICKTCGNTEENHYFRHQFEGTIPITVKDDQFILDAQHFPEKIITKCGVKNCGKIESAHGVDIPEEMRSPLADKDDPRVIKHDFEPEEIKYREIVFNLPLQTKCCWKVNKDEHSECGIRLEKHEDCMSKDHHFTTSVTIKNRNDKDKIRILNPDDEDVKIIWE